MLRLPRGTVQIIIYGTDLSYHKAVQYEKMNEAAAFGMPWLLQPIRGGFAPL